MQKSGGTRPVQWSHFYEILFYFLKKWGLHRGIRRGAQGTAPTSSLAVLDEVGPCPPRCCMSPILFAQSSMFHLSHSPCFCFNCSSSFVHLASCMLFICFIDFLCAPLATISFQSQILVSGGGSHMSHSFLILALLATQMRFGSASSILR